MERYYRIHLDLHNGIAREYYGVRAKEMEFLFAIYRQLDFKTVSGYAL